MLAFLAHSCYNAITGSVWSGSFNWLNNFTSIDDPRIFGTAIPDVRGLSYKGSVNGKTQKSKYRR